MNSAECDKKKKSFLPACLSLLWRLKNPNAMTKVTSSEHSNLMQLGQWLFNFFSTTVVRDWTFHIWYVTSQLDMTRTPMMTSK